MANKRRPQGDGTVRLCKDGRWEGRIIVDYDEKGNPKGKSVFAKTKTECEKKLAKMIAEKKAEIAKQKKAQKKD